MKGYRGYIEPNYESNDRYDDIMEYMQMILTDHEIFASLYIKYLEGAKTDSYEAFASTRASLSNKVFRRLNKIESTGKTYVVINKIYKCFDDLLKLNRIEYFTSIELSSVIVNEENTIKTNVIYNLNTVFMRKYFYKGFNHAYEKCILKGDVDER